MRWTITPQDLVDEYTQLILGGRGAGSTGLLATFTDDGMLELDRGVCTGRETIRRALAPGVDARRSRYRTAGTRGCSSATT